MTTLFVIYAIALIAYIVGIRLIFWRFFSPLQKRVFLSLNVITFVIYALYVFNIYSSPQSLPFWNWFLNVNEEFGLMATYSSMILLVTGFAAAGMALFVGGRQRGFWILNAAVFTFLAMDEYFVIHESIQESVGRWQIIYMVSGVLVVLLSIAFWWPRTREQAIPLALYLIGLGVIGASGIALDYVFQELACRNQDLGMICADLNLIEEIMETLGTCFVLSLFLRLASEVMPPARKRFYWPALAVVAFVWVFFVMGYWWLFPKIALQNANRVDVQFDEGRVSLVGYSLPTQEIQAGGVLTVITYWQAHDLLGELYQVSGHILTNDLQSIAQDDPIVSWFPSYAWLPGAVISKTLNIPIPDTIEAPYGYTLSVSLWNFRQPDAEVSVIGDLPLLFGSTVGLAQVTALDPEPLPPAPESDQFRVDTDAQLLGFDLPESAQQGETITVRFWWQAGNAPFADYAQYLHLLPDDPQNAIVFDQIPLDGTLPTANWIPNLAFVDDWQIAIPDDAPLGEYEVVSGFFNQLTGDRLPVTGIDDAPTRDMGMILGTLEIVENSGG